MTIKLSEMDYEELLAHTKDVAIELRRKIYNEGYEAGYKWARMDGKMEGLAQEKRDRIVEQAKEDITKLKVKEYLYDGEYYLVSTSGSDFVCRAEFVVNSDKRTVVALMRGYSTGNVRAKGIAKCAPDDCFNVHIGKAISIRRALGLDVPDEYIYAPQPTEARVGDVVRGNFDGEIMTISERVRDFDGIFGKAYRVEDLAGWLGDEQFHIIDDTREV